MTLEEESDNSLHSDVEIEAGEDGVKFFDVKNACGGADEVPELAEGEAALKEALPLAEALDEVALDFVAPLIALFGEGWTRCFYSRNWQCRVAALTHLSAIMAQRLEDVSDAPLAELLDGCMPSFLPSVEPWTVVCWWPIWPPCYVSFALAWAIPKRWYGRRPHRPCFGC